MNSKSPILLTILCCTSLAVNAQLTSYVDLNDGRPTPNVILLLTDDLGWQDTKTYDIDDPSHYETPNIDALAEEGVQFWQAYSPAPTCSPSRCAIMSGNHPARAQKTHVSGGEPPSPNSNNSRMMDPWYSGRMPENEVTLARVLQENGYTTGHAGKWHMSKNHAAFPQPENQGFDITTSSRGVTTKQLPNRLSNFSTNSMSDPYRLDENGFPFHQNNQDALDFLENNNDTPFFLYYATWLVHAPIQTRSESLLIKYLDILGMDYPTSPNSLNVEVQNNPYYCAMVEMLDYYTGQIFDYLEITDDPRWPGHKLSENTYIIFTSDNGGMERVAGETVTDNFPLDKGKINSKEGGIRVPLIVTGPGISEGLESEVMVNGLDLYPTILSLLDINVPENKNLDGDNLSSLLLNDPTDSSLVLDKNGEIRNTMMWHFPHSAYQSALREGDYKLIRNYNFASNPSTQEFELYKLYDSSNGVMTRLDIEESNNLSSALPELRAEMNDKLTTLLTEMNASYPSFNPLVNTNVNNELIPTNLMHSVSDNNVTFTFQENGAEVVHANLIYTLNGGETYEEWFSLPLAITPEINIITTELPIGTTHYILNLIDENDFLVSFPEVPAKNDITSNSFTPYAFTNLVDTPTLSVGNSWYHNYSPNEFNVSIASVNSGTLLAADNAVPTPSTFGNESTIVAKFTKSNGIHSSIKFNLPSILTEDKKDQAIFKIKLLVPQNTTATNNNIKVLLRDGSDTSTQISIAYNINVFSQWQEYTFDFSTVDFRTSSYSDIYLFFAQPDHDFDGTGNVYYFDAFQGPAIETLSTNNLLEKKYPKIYPNPVKETFQISETILTANIFNILGQKVKSFSKNQNEYSISNLPNGIYFIEFFLNDTTKFTNRIVKK
ncbi:MAG: sulfatase-like hydrolase/transferase [Bacteroidota bacterium]